jgi:hypothetical protein
VIAASRAAPKRILPLWLNQETGPGCNQSKSEAEHRGGQ